MRHLNTLILVSTLFFIPDEQGALAAEQQPNLAIDAIFAEYDHADTPGCALGVIREGAFIYRRGYGSANLDYDIPLSAQSVFRIASTSKQFTAMAVALLAESGRISLDDSLRSYFPEFPFWADRVTIRQLLQHTSGVRDYLTLAELSGKGSDADYYTDDWVMALLARQEETNFLPGSQHLYSNSGYLLLAHLAKRVSGQSLREISQEQIFGPLGMSHTHFHDDHTEVVPNRATGYEAAGERYHVSMTTLDMVGDGGVFTTIDDLLAWDKNFYQNRLGRDGQDLIELLTTPATLTDGTVTDYAFGLSIGDYRGLKLVSHGGAFVGYRAEIVRFPDQHFSVAVLCNRADAAPSMLALQVAEIYLADLMAAEPESEAQSEPAAPGMEISAAELERFTGDYWEETEGFAAESRVIDGKLWAVHSPERRNQLVPVGPDRFEMIGVPAKVYVQFIMDQDRIVEVRRTINGKPRGVFIPFERRQLSAGELEEYAGDYYSPELDVHYFLALDGDHLIFNFDDEGPLDLTAMFGETFENPDYGSFTFLRDAGGAITGFRLQSGRVRDLAFDRVGPRGVRVKCQSKHSRF